MLYRPELLIYLWMLPVLALVILPALWTFTGILYRAVEWSRLADVRGYLDIGQGESADPQIPERRRFPRISIEGRRAKIARKVKCCKAYVANISSCGLCFSNMPSKMFRAEENTLKVVFRTRERDYTMFVRPRWGRRGEGGYVIGTEIVKGADGWDAFVSSICQPVFAEAA